MSAKNFITTLTQISEHATDQGVIYLNTEDDNLEGNIITVDQKKIVNFGSCSYLGLEFDERLKNAAIKAIQSYGTQFSCSRAYISTRYYVELENKLKQLFGAPTVSTPTTTLGHVAAIPVIVSPKDVIILDHQVHSSVQTAASLVKPQGTRVELMRHNRMDILEERILTLRDKHEKIWYMADGIYSMYGDAAPLQEIKMLLDKYPQLHFYVDDAHGMSVFGENGRGYVLSQIDMHERMIVATSFAKGFGTGGGALIFPNEEIANTVRDCGGPLRASGPMQPAALGAAIASADIHLSEQISIYQEDLQENIKYTNLMLKKHGLPNMAESFSPIFFIAVSLPKIAYKIINRVKQDGHFLNLGIFPAVPIKNTGIRFTITRLHTFEQIETMIHSLKLHFEQVLMEENMTLNEILKPFKGKTSISLQKKDKTNNPVSHLKVKLSNTIKDLDKKTWNNCFQEKNAYDWETMVSLEKSFHGNNKDYQNWDFRYITIHDLNGKLVLATFMTVSLSKDDMLSPKEVSIEVENRRLSDPYYMTSKTLCLGSPITEGEHLHLDKSSNHYRDALTILLKEIEKVQDELNVTTTILREFSMENKELDTFFVDNGFFKVEMPEKAEINNLNWKDRAAYYSTLTNKKKGHFRRNILKHIEKYNVQLCKNPTNEELTHFYELYKNVKNKSKEINTFSLPFKLFKNLAINENWEIISLSLKSDITGEQNTQPVAFGFCHKSKSSYTFTLLGVDYNQNFEHSCYRQTLYQVVKRAGELGFENVKLGFTSIMEKRHFGAKPEQSCAYIQVKDNFKIEALGAMSLTNKTNKNGVDERRVLPV